MNMITLVIAATVLRIPAEWVVWFTSMAYRQAPDNLVAFQWVVITTLGGVVVGLAAYIRSLWAEMRQMAKDHAAQILALTERSLTAGHEMKETVKDNTEAIGILGEKLERSGRARTTRTGKNNG